MFELCGPQSGRRGTALLATALGASRTSVLLVPQGPCSYAPWEEAATTRSLPTPRFCPGSQRPPGTRLQVRGEEAARPPIQVTLVLLPLAPQSALPSPSQGASLPCE